MIRKFFDVVRSFFSRIRHSGKSGKQIAVAVILLGFAYVLANVVIAGIVARGVRTDLFSVKARRAYVIAPFFVKMDDVVVSTSKADVKIATLHALSPFLPLSAATVSVDGMNLSKGTLPKKDLSLSELKGKRLPLAYRILSLDVSDIHGDYSFGNAVFSVRNGLARGKRLTLKSISDFSGILSLSFPRVSGKIRGSRLNAEFHSTDAFNTDGDSLVHFVSADTFLNLSYATSARRLKIASLPFSFRASLVNYKSMDAEASLGWDGVKSDDDDFDYLSLPEGTLKIKGSVDDLSKAVRGAPVKARVTFSGKPAGSVTASVGKRSLRLSVRICERDYPVDPSIVKKFSADVRDLSVGYMAFHAEPGSLQAVVSDEGILISDMHLGGSLRTDATMDRNYVLHDASASASASGLRIGSDLSPYGDLLMTGRADVTYHMLGRVIAINAKDINYRAELIFAGSFVPGIVSAADFRYKKFIFNTTVHVRGEKRHYDGVKDFFDNHSVDINLG